MDESTPQQPAAPTKRILCIEDEHFISELYAHSLGKAGYDVKVVFDGLEGFNEAKTNAYDIILLDLMIPSMLGIDILKRLRAEVPDLRAKIIITTNLEQTKEHRKQIEDQADGYVIKAEITPRQLVDFLSHVA